MTNPNLHTVADNHPGGPEAGTIALIKLMSDQPVWDRFVTVTYNALRNGTDPEPIWDENGEVIA